jgi:hypothetical protein
MPLQSWERKMLAFKVGLDSAEEARSLPCQDSNLAAIS